jgi:small subunit ribosomal protein S8e
MVLDQQVSKRKVSGGIYKPSHKKKKHSLGRDATLTRIAEKTIRVVRVRGGNKKRRLVSSNVANVLDPKTGKYSKATIEIVKENPGNRHFVRRNIMTKGTVIKTNLGDARITSRPGQDGTINAVLVK